MADTVDDVPLPGFEPPDPPDYSTAKIEHPSGRAWTKMAKDIDQILDLCDCGTIPGKTHMTSTPEFFTKGVNFGTGISVLTCPDCRPLVSKIIDANYGRHDDEVWPRTPKTDD